MKKLWKKYSMLLLLIVLSCIFAFIIINAFQSDVEDHSY